MPQTDGTICPKANSVNKGEETMENRITPHTVWDVRCFDKDGNLKWEELGLPNIWHDEGEEWICKVVFSEAQAVPASYYLGLDARGSLSEADTLTSLSGEPSGNGYARQAVASDATDWTVAKGGGDRRGA